MSEDAAAVARHYGRPNLATEILAALQAAGKDPTALTRDDLAPFEELHIRGREATRELARLAALPRGAMVIDVGCGVGGPARTMAADFGLRVVGVDLVEEFVDAAEALTKVSRVDPAPEFRVADATALPLPDASFDGAFIQHVSVHVRDKARLFAEVRRALKPGGVLALYEICAGPTPGGPHYPVVWAAGPETSFLVAPQELRTMVERAGLSVEHWEDDSPACLAWYQELTARRAQEGPAPLGMELVLGPDFGKRAANTARSLHDGRIAVVMGRLVAV